MNRRDPQQGVTLIFLLGVIATLGVLATILVMVTANVMGATANDRTKTKAFDVAEAALDEAMYSMGISWPSSVDDFAFDETTFAAKFSTDEYPRPTSGSFATVTVTAAATDDHYWLTATANVGDQRARIRTEVEKQSVGSAGLQSGVAVWSGGSVTMTGSAAVTSPSSSGQWTGSLYASTSLDTSGGNPTISALIYTPTLTKASWQTFAKTGSDVVSQETVFPSSLVSTLTAASKAATMTGTEISNSTAGFSYPWGCTYTSPVYCTGDLHVNTQGTYTFTTIYVAGNLTIDGSAQMNCTALFVGGSLTVSGGANTQSFGPTYVAGDVSFSGYQTFSIPLLVTEGNVTISGSQYVGTADDPCELVMIGSNKTFTDSGNNPYYGIVANLTGGATSLSGSCTIDGALISTGPVSLTGTGSVYYDSDVVNQFASSTTTSAKIVPDTWEELSPN